jgi:hypothetical protein
MAVTKGGKNNTAELVGSTEKERFHSTRVYGRFAGTGWMQRLVRHNQVTTNSGGGPDVAEMFDTRHTDSVSGWPDECAYQAGKWEYRVQDFPSVSVNGEAAGSDMAHLYSRDSDTVRERTDDWIMSGDGFSITVDKSFGAVEVHDGLRSGSQSALARPNELWHQDVPEHDLTILAQGLRSDSDNTNQTEDEEEAVDSVLRTELWWT